MTPAALASDLYAFAEFIKEVPASPWSESEFPGSYAGGEFTELELMEQAAPRFTPLGERAKGYSEGLTDGERLTLAAWYWPNHPGAPASRPTADFQAALENAAWALRQVANKDPRVGSSDEERWAWTRSVLKHVEWTTRLSLREVRWVLGGHDAADDDFGFRDGEAPLEMTVDEALTLTRALRLRYTADGRWTIDDRDALRAEILASAEAIDAFNLVRRLPPEALTRALSRLPKSGVRAQRAGTVAAVEPPGKSSRYRPLFSHLRRQNTDIVEIRQGDECVRRDEDHEGLPDRAWLDERWWSGTERSASSRPHLAAAFAAGYRFDSLTLASGDEPAVLRFVAVTPPPGAAPQDIGRRTRTLAELRDEERVRFYEQRDAAADMAEKLNRAIAAHGLDHVLQRLEEHAVRLVRKAVADRGEASRGQIVEELVAKGLGTYKLDADPGADLADQLNPLPPAWVTKVIQKAKRRGLIVNRGSRTEPKWTVTRA